MDIDYFNLLKIHVPQRKNMFSLEGIDGSGKSTQLRNVANALSGLGIESLSVASPSTGLIGEFVRNNMKRLFGWERNALFLMDFIHVLQENSDPSKILLWDRYVDSGYVSNRDMTIDQAVEWLSILPDATKTFLLDIDPKLVVMNRSESAHDHSNDLIWQQFKRDRYETLVEMFPDRIVRIDACQNPDAITDQIVSVIYENIEK